MASSKELLMGKPYTTDTRGDSKRDNMTQAGAQSLAAGLFSDYLVFKFQTEILS